MIYLKIAYSSLLLTLTCVMYVKLYYRTKDVLNPFGLIIASWGIVCSLAALQLSIIESKWTATMYFIGLIFPMSVYFGTIIGKNKYIMRKKAYSKIEFSNLYIVVSRVLFVICLFCAYMEWKEQGFILTFGLSDISGDTKQMVKTLSGWHYGTVYLPYCSINACFEMCFRKKGTVINRILLLVQLIVPIVHSLLIVSSRGSLLIILLGCIFVLSRRFELKFNKMYLVGIAIIYLLIKIAEKRIWSTSLVFRIIPGKPVLSSIYSYTALNFENLNKLTKMGPSFTVCVRSLYGLFQLFGLSGLFPENPREVTYFFNAVPIAYDFYDDLWVIGIILYSVFLTIGLKYLYCKCNKYSEYIIIMAALQKAIWVVFFGNYFSAYRIVIFPYLVSWILIKMNSAVLDLKHFSIKRKKVVFDRYREAVIR